MSGCGKYVHVHVRLACGHEHEESRPPNVAWPVEGEERVCGSFEHYPKCFVAAYTNMRVFDEFHTLEHTK